MPRDLFGEVVVRPRSARARRSSVVVMSVSAHAIAIAAVAIAQLLGVDGLPVPHETLAFAEVQAIGPVDIELPSRAPGRAHARPAQTASRAAAPLQPPRDISPETAGEDAPRVIGPEPALAVESSRPGLVNGVGLRAQGPPPPPPPVAPVRLHAGMRPPQRMSDVAPEYPQIARAAHVEGVVILEATIDVDGRVRAAHVLRSIPLLDAAALDAVRQWRFSPALLNGVPVPVIMTVTVKFAIAR